MLLTALEIKRKRIQAARHRSRIQQVVCKYLPRPPKALYDIGVGPKQEWKLLHNRYPRMKVYGCEPNPHYYQELKSVFPGKLSPVAVSDEHGERTLYMALMQSTLFAVPELTAKDTVTVPVWTLDEFDDWAGKRKDVLLWMDIEGSELAALRGAPRLLASGRVFAMNLEVRDNRLSPDWPIADEIQQFLSVWGYRLVREYNTQKTCPAEGYKHRDAIYLRESVL